MTPARTICRVVAALAALVAGAKFVSFDPPPARPNIVLVIGDDHGWPYYGFMESPETVATSSGRVPVARVVQTPNLDRLAARGVVFTRGYATASLCLPSLQTLLSASGLHPGQWAERRRRLSSGLARGVPYSQQSRFYRTLPRELARYGYRSWEGGKMWEGAFDDAGFSDGTAKVANPINLGPDGQYFGREGWDPELCGSTRREDATLLCPALEPLREFLDGNRSSPFFLWVAPLLPHNPFNAPPPYRKAYRDLGIGERQVAYLANVRWFDELFGELVAELQRRRNGRDTLLIYVSDNGWSLDGRRVRGKGSQYDLGMRTPIIFSGLPGMVPARHDEAVSTSDIAATIIGYVGGARAPAGSRGRDLRRRIEGGRPVSRGVLVAEHGEAAIAVQLPWKYLRRKDGVEELYRIDRDPLERRSLAAEHPAVLAELRHSVDLYEETLFEPPADIEVVGRLLDERDVPMADVDLIFRTHDFERMATTDSGGWFALRGLPPQAGVLTAVAGVRELRWPGAPTLHPSFELTSVYLELRGVAEPPDAAD